MIIRYTKPAARQLATILDYVANVFDRIEGTLALIAVRHAREIYAAAHLTRQRERIISPRVRFLEAF